MKRTILLIGLLLLLVGCAKDDLSLEEEVDKLKQLSYASGYLECKQDMILWLTNASPTFPNCDRFENKTYTKEYFDDDCEWN